jgi:hypothetical protein
MVRPAQRDHLRVGADGWLAAVAFLGLAIAGTWPLSRALTSSLPGDYGDPLFVAWVMAWVARQITRALTGDPGALVTMWDAPIFAPEPNTLAFSEHFVGQAVQALPVFWLTGNPLLAYNLVFLATFVLSGVAAYVFVRELTGSPLGGLVAGALFSMNDFRTFSLWHLHTLSAQWLPLACLGVWHFARSGSRRALAGAALSVIALNTSSGYYMLYGAPLIGAFGLVVLMRHTAWRTRRGATCLILAGAAVALVQVPLVLPYLELQRVHQFTRSRVELELYSYPLDLYRSRLPYLAPMLALSAASLLGWRSKGVGLRWAIVFFASAGVLALWLSLGPVPRLNGAPFGLPGLYDVLYTYVPGYSGLRVVGRIAVVLVLALAVLAGIGAAQLARRAGRVGMVVAVALAATHLYAQWMGPIPLDGPLPGAGLNPAAGYLRPAPEMPDIYRFVAATPPSSVLAEFPFGDPGYELRYMFFGLMHQRRLLNGYSGFFPRSYRDRAALLKDPPARPDDAWAALAPATHVLVHSGAWDDGLRTTIGEWLEGHGARVLATRGDAVLWQLSASR